MRHGAKCSASSSPLPRAADLDHDRLPRGDATRGAARGLREAVRYECSTESWSGCTPERGGDRAGPRRRRQPGLRRQPASRFSETQATTSSPPSSCAVARPRLRTGSTSALVDMRLPDGLGTDLAESLKERNPTRPSSCSPGTRRSRRQRPRYVPVCSPTSRSRRHTRPSAHARAGSPHRELRRDKRELHRRAQTAEKLAAVGTMTAGLSHEIRNPLNAAGLQLQVLERRIEKLAASRGRRCSSRSAWCATRSAGSTTCSRTSCSSPGHGSWLRPPIDLPALIGRVLDLLAKDAERRGISSRGSWVRFPLSPVTTGGCGRW